MRLGIDASNIRSGGGVTHLVELLRAADPLSHGFSQVVVWSGRATLDRIENRPWLVKSYQPLLNRDLPYRTFWQRFRLSGLALASDCDVLFVPGSLYMGSFRPMVTMSRNLLPFEWQELRRYGWSWMALRILILRLIQSGTFRRADGLIFLTQYARNVVLRTIKYTSGKTATIPHGIDKSFTRPLREQTPINRYSIAQPFRILYVSIIDVYKHQWHVAKAVAQLRAIGLPVLLDLVGPAYPPALKRMKKILASIDPLHECVQYSGAVPHSELHHQYARTDLCLFASSCENMPNILLEGMASALPIACSDRGPMPEVLGDAGVYFDPENPDDIARALRALIESHELRAKLAKASLERSQAYSWGRCAKETFGFLAEVAKGHRTNHSLPIHC